MVPTAVDLDGSLFRSQPFPEETVPREEQLGSALQQGFTTAGWLCPEERFLAALELIGSKLGPGVIGRAGGKQAVLQYYLDHQANNKCRGRAPTSHWPRSSAYPRQRLDGSGDVTGLLVNVGSGENSLGFLSCVMGDLGLRLLERGGEEASNMRLRLHGTCGLLPETGEDGRSCTDLWDAYDYVDDWPVEDQLPQLLASHPAPVSAGVLLPLVDPWSWVAKRTQVHENAAAEWTAPSPCTGHGPRLELEDAPIAKLSHDAWAACVAVELGGRDSLFAFHLNSDYAGDFDSELHGFLNAQTDGTESASNYSLPRVREATGNCRNWLEPTDGSW